MLIRTLMLLSYALRCFEHSVEERVIRVDQSSAQINRDPQLNCSQSQVLYIYILVFDRVSSKYIAELVEVNWAPARAANPLGNYQYKNAASCLNSILSPTNSDQIRTIREQRLEKFVDMQDKWCLYCWGRLSTYVIGMWALRTLYKQH